MKVIDKYILKKFLSAYFFVVLILVAVITVIDFTEKNDDFIKHSLSIGEILGYYKVVIPFYANLLTPITVFIATVFVTSKMAGHTEIIAILSGGISFTRMMRPYLIGSIIVAALSFYLNGWVIPDSNKKRVEFEVKYVKNPFHFSERNIHIQEGPNTFLYMQSYSNRNNTGIRFSLETVEGTEVVEKLTADRIEWKEEEGKWLVKNWTLREFDGLKETVTRGKELDTLLRIHPKDFENNYKRWEALTNDELNVYVRELKARGSTEVPTYEIERYIRYMAPFTVIILTFIGMIVSARKTRGGTGFQIALGFLIAFIFIIFYILSRSVAEAGNTNPVLAVWFPNIVFSIVGFVLYKTVPR
ncbi:LptF/LptG family permease [Fulvivirgaceae bacterium BMA10]|uniref:LptF/LptG family permease n=1 Tax=Splendidivirga corallicola TaxID=3051826 RepID=A0ABT8KID3_9BACT|nr:LptF/LptG family permease [Fulvivirgaceae bacterium BMA10]